MCVNRLSQSFDSQQPQANYFAAGLHSLLAWPGYRPSGLPSTAPFLSATVYHQGQFSNGRDTHSHPHLYLHCEDSLAVGILGLQTLTLSEAQREQEVSSSWDCLRGSMHFVVGAENSLNQRHPKICRLGGRDRREGVPPHFLWGSWARVVCKMKTSSSSTGQRTIFIN